jgi:aspartyl-tRNA synthetase
MMMRKNDKIEIDFQCINMHHQTAYRSHLCGQINQNDCQKQINLSGWVGAYRDHGGIIFMDCRDFSGKIQLVFEPENTDVFEQAQKLRDEWVVAITGIVRQRPDGTVNQSIDTGLVEVVVESLEILSAAKPLPFPIEDRIEAGENVRLQHRFLDLRRPVMQSSLRLRSKVIHAFRDVLQDQGFVDIETPYLTRSTPEGARDYLVPSRTQPGHCFALPQSPQVFKQLLMISGFDRYYQVARCFRDEDLRADRQPEFTQLDLEMAFVKETDVMTVVESSLRQIFKTCLDTTLEPIARMSYQSAMMQYGSDKPDLRFGCPLVDIRSVAKQSSLAILAQAAHDDQMSVMALTIADIGDQCSRKKLDELNHWIQKFGAKGLAYLKVEDDAKGLAGIKSPIAKGFTEQTLKSLYELTQAKTNDVIFFGAGATSVVQRSLGQLRLKLGQDYGLIQQTWAPVWITDFPLFEKNDAGQMHPMHHPFTAPQGDLNLLESAPDQLNARAYDLVLNGFEIGGGSVRIHDASLQKRVFASLGMDETMMQQEFGHLLEGLMHGSPPHAGFAMGLDRLLMLMAGVDSIRDVMAFPKTQTAQCVLTKAPAQVLPEQWIDLHCQPILEDADGGS